MQDARTSTCHEQGEKELNTIMHKARDTHWHTHTNTQHLCTHTHKPGFDRVTPVECVYHKLQPSTELPKLCVFLEPLYPASGWASHTHTGTNTEAGARWSTPGSGPFYDWGTAEGWSLLPLSASIPTWLTAACQNTRAVSGKLWIKVWHPLYEACRTPCCFQQQHTQWRGKKRKKRTTGDPGLLGSSDHWVCR